LDSGAEGLRSTLDIVHVNVDFPRVDNTVGSDHEPLLVVLNFDDDGDGVINSDDQCAMTAIPEEGVPTEFLRNNRYALTGTPDNMTFQSTNKTVFTTADTGGCSCEQIIAELDLGSSQTKFGCSKSVMLQWINQLP